MTDRLYYRDPYLRTFDATVARVCAEAGWATKVAAIGASSIAAATVVRSFAFTGVTSTGSIDTPEVRPVSWTGV